MVHDHAFDGIGIFGIGYKLKYQAGIDRIALEKPTQD